jgi:TATA-binding protein-associated factor
MGLGKSLQTICIVASKHEERRLAYAKSQSVETQPLPSLIICPPTLVGHWYHEFKKFAPQIRTLRYAGNARERQGLRGAVATHEVIITSYEVIRSDSDLLSSLDWLFCVLDEGHIIKNGKTKLSKAIKTIRSTHRLILSGTPIQNNVLELWNLFDFLMPGFLGTEKQFSDRFSKPILANRSGKATPKEQEGGELQPGPLIWPEALV